MGLSALSGPLVVHGPGPVSGAGTQSVLPPSPDAGPSTHFGGTTLFDSRFVYKGGGGTENSALLAIGLGPNGGYTVLDQAPSAITTANIAVATSVANGVAMTLVSVSGAGITVTSAANTILQTGNIVPTATLAIDLVPGLVYFGTNKSTAVADPTKNIARALAITAASGAASGAFIVSGYDLYGYPQTEKITAASSPTGTTTTKGKKSFKFIKSVTPQFANSFAYSVGTSDIYGFPILVNSFPYAQVGWAGALIASSTGFVAADTTSPATNTTGDVRGTYAVQSASTGTTTLQMFITVSPANVSTLAGIFGQTPA